MCTFASKAKLYTEWNLFYPHRGHNLADSHAGHTKRAVRRQEKNYHLTKSVDDVIPALNSLSNTTVINLNPEVILANDEKTAASFTNKGFIKKYFHYVHKPGNTLLCKHFKNQGNYGTEKIRQK